MPKKPNLLILHTHDMGRYNSAYGYQLPTLRMAELAGEGVIFRDAHCAAPTCSPSRAAMLTGRTAHEAGMCGLTHRGWDLHDYDAHLAAWLGRQGWHTVLAGIQHEFQDEARMPYQERIPLKRDLVTANAVAEWLEQPREEPFFLWTGLFLPHVQFLKADPKRFPQSRMQPPPCLPDNAQTRADWANYSASVERTDQSFGVILDALHHGGHAENTIVILTTDHGVPLPHMKCSLTAHGTGVTLMLKDPRHPKTAGTATDALVSHLDVFPTICDLLDVPAPDNLHGTSLVPLLRGECESVREDIFAEVTYHSSYEPKRSVRTKRWNYIRSFDEDRRRPLANIDWTPTKQQLMDAGLGQRPTDAEALYDLIFDPQESCNLASHPEHAAVLTEMRARLDAWLDKTDDPIRHGPIPLRKGGKVNPRESINPKDPPIVQE